jgi:hypothetical protein
MNIKLIDQFCQSLLIDQFCQYNIKLKKVVLI